MICEARGAIFPDVYALGNPQVPIFAMRCGAEWSIVEGGVSALSALVIRQLRELTGDLARVTAWFITHAHYDHCGLLPYLMPLLPNVRVYGSAGTAAAFCKPSALRVIRTLNASVSAAWWEQFGPDATADGAYAPLESIHVEVVEGDQEVALSGGFSLRAVPTPGHSACQLAFIEPRRGCCFVSDALGEYLEDGSWCPLVFDNAPSYLASIRRIGALAPTTVIAAHHAVFTDSDAESAVRGAEQAFEALRERATVAHAQPGGLAELAMQMSREVSARSAEFVSGELHLASMRKMLALLTERSEAEHVARL